MEETLCPLATLWGIIRGNVTFLVAQAAEGLARQIQAPLVIQLLIMIYSPLEDLRRVVLRAIQAVAQGVEVRLPHLQPTCNLGFQHQHVVLEVAEGQDEMFVKAQELALLTVDTRGLAEVVGATQAMRGVLEAQATQDLREHREHLMLFQ